MFAIINKNSNTHLYKIIENDLRSKLKSKEIKPGEKIGTEKELADSYDVSRSTVRQALEGLEEQGLIDRLLGKGTFASENRNSELNSHKIISVIIPVISQNFIGDIVMGIQEVLSDAGYYISLSITDSSTVKEENYLQEAYENNVAGIILHPTNSPYYNKTACALIDKIPLVMTGRYYRFFDCNYVVPDNYRGLFKITQYLIDLGHTSIGLVSDHPQIQTSIEDRIAGFRDCLNHNGIALKKGYMLTDLSDPCKLYSPNASSKCQLDYYGRIQQYFQENDGLTAVIGVNDSIARDLINVAGRLGLKVPDDISIAGHDNVSLAFRTEPPITTIDWSQIELGRVAARELIDLIEKKEAGARKVRRVLPVELVERGSTAPLSPKRS